MTDSLFDLGPQSRRQSRPEVEDEQHYPREMPCATPVKVGKRRICGHPYHAHFGRGGTCIRGAEGLAGSVCPCLRFTPSP